jgi:hypothetical protein
MIRLLWHRYVLRHHVERLGKITPDRITPGGIAVYEQTEFRPPMAHWKCRCGETWT